MKKSTLILLLLFLLSGAGTLWYLNQEDEKKTTLVEADSDFAVKDTDQIGKIFLASRIRGNQLTFERKGENWVLNDSLPAHPKVIKSLLNAMRTMQIKYRPSEAAIENIVKGLAVDQVKTEIYDRQGKLMKTYYVGGETADARGTYMIMEGSEKPYVMELKGMTGNFKVRFDLAELEAQDKAIFRDDRMEINYVSIDYPTRRNQSFILDNKGAETVVKPLYETTPVINKPVLKGSAEAYFEKFKDIIAEAIVHNPKGAETFGDLIPFAIMTVGYKDGAEKVIEFFPRGSRDPFTKEKLNAIDRFDTRVNGKNDPVYLTQLQMMQKLFLGYPSFF